MVEQIDTAIIGGGQAGLAMSYWLTQQGREHVVLERGQIGERWRNERWDSLTLMGPNWLLLQLPGFGYQGDDPDGFLPKDDVVRLLEDYAASFKPPLRCGVEVKALRRQPETGHYVVHTGETTIEAANVVIATGPYQKPKVSPLSAALPDQILQLTATTYRNPARLPPGAVLVVGSGASGCQICEELYESGRQVYLSVGRCGRVVRRYRGRDSSGWLHYTGRLDQTVASLPSEASLDRCGGQSTGVRGGHDLDYRRFAVDGVILLGRLQSVAGGRLHFAGDLAETLVAWDESLAVNLGAIDDFIERNGIEAPPDDPPSGVAPAGWTYVEPPLELDLAERGITTVIWATGFTYDFSWVELPVFDASGSPIHQRGVTTYPGLYFLGLRWQHTFKSAFINGAGEDAAYLASVIGGAATAERADLPPASLTAAPSKRRG